MGLRLVAPQRSIYIKIVASSRILNRLTQMSIGPLFDNSIEPEDIPSGTIYVLRSLSQQPEIVAIQ